VNPNGTTQICSNCGTHVPKTIADRYPVEPKVLLKGNLPEQDGDARHRKETGTQSRFTEMGYPNSTCLRVNSFTEISLIYV